MAHDSYTIDGVPLDDPAGRWRLTSKTELPQWGAMVSPSAKIPHRNGVLPIAPIAAGVSTVKLELLILAAHQTDGLRTIRSITGARSLHQMEWTRASGGEVLGADVRLSSSVSVKNHGVDGDLLVSFTVEAVAGEWRRTTLEKVDAGTNQRKSFPIITGKNALVPTIAVKASTDGGTVTVRDTLGTSTMSVGRVPSGSWLLVDTEGWDVRSIPAGKEQTAGEDDISQMPRATQSIPTLSITPGGFRLEQRTNGDGVVEAIGGSAILWWVGAY